MLKTNTDLCGRRGQKARSKSVLTMLRPPSRRITSTLITRCQTRYTSGSTGLNSRVDRLGGPDLPPSPPSGEQTAISDAEWELRTGAVSKPSA